MKKTFLQILFILLTVTARVHAGTNDGILSITNLSRQELRLEIDGQVYADYKNALVIRDLRPGNHLIKVSIINRLSRNRHIMIYNKNVYVKPRFYVDLVINRFSRVLYDEQQITGSEFDSDGREDQGSRDNSNNGRPPGNYNNPPRPMADNSFNSFIETIRRESFDDSRMAIAKSGIDQNYFTSAQARQLITLFSFENSKLEIAKYMYGKTTDPKNYFVVYSVFSFSKTKEELAEYVRTYKP